MDLRDWIDEIASRGGIMTIDDFAALPAGHPTQIAPLELLAFELARRPHRFPHLEPGKVYAPKDFFEPVALTFVRETGLETRSLSYANESGPGTTEKSTDRLSGRFVYSDGSDSSVEVYSARPDRHASTGGGGDGWTRYATIATLYDPDLPPVRRTD